LDRPPAAKSRRCAARHWWLEETETSITGKLARGTFAASFLLACLTVLEMEELWLGGL